MTYSLSPEKLARTPFSSLFSLLGLPFENQKVTERRSFLCVKQISSSSSLLWLSPLIPTLFSLRIGLKPPPRYYGTTSSSLQLFLHSSSLSLPAEGILLSEGPPLSPSPHFHFRTPGRFMRTESSLVAAFTRSLSPSWNAFLHSVPPHEGGPLSQMGAPL